MTRYGYCKHCNKQFSYTLRAPKVHCPECIKNKVWEGKQYKRKPKEKIVLRSGWKGINYYFQQCANSEVTNNIQAS